jgi:hypothetical protein
MIRPQAIFPVHEGILDFHGPNTVAVVLWSMEAKLNILPKLSVRIEGIYEGGVGTISIENPKWEVRSRGM